MATIVVTETRAVEVPDFPDGPFEMTGTILSVSWRSRKTNRHVAWGAWSRRPHVGMLVELDGPECIRVFGTVPKSVERALLDRLYERRHECINYSELVDAVTIRVRFTASVTAADTIGHAHGYFKLPRRAVLLD